MRNTVAVTIHVSKEKYKELKRNSKLAGLSLTQWVSFLIGERNGQSESEILNAPTSYRRMEGLTVESSQSESVSE